ncbi:MAG: radical SAM protein [Treponema sp.]|jgi:radical SAM superfamily enzyme YgiQ (UPF0313 family)|nr:radical SAM protein [Treponema sp.]
MKIVLAAVHLEKAPEAVPLGAACVASALKAAFPGKAAVTLIETFLMAENGIKERGCVEDDAADILVKNTLDQDPDAVGFSLFSWNRNAMLKAASAIRAQSPETFLFCGGPEATALPGGLSLAEGGPFDAVISGEGELAAVRIIGEIFFGAAEDISEKKSAVIPAQFLSEADLAALPSPWLDGVLTVRGREGVLWELTRGCPYACAYCYESKGEKKVKRFPDARLREELKLFIREGAGFIFVLDPTFNSDTERAIRLLDMIACETHRVSEIQNISPSQKILPPPVHWHFEVRAELLTRAQARRFAALGASLQIGLQTAESNAAALCGRPFDATDQSGQAIQKKFRSKIDILNEEGVIFGLDLIYGLPGDTLAGFLRSLDFALSLYPNNIDLFRLQVLPGTVFWDRAEELGIKMRGNYTGGDHNGGAPYEVIATADFPASDIERAERISRWADYFYNRGRAVPWFNQIIRVTGLRASAFLEDFAGFAESAALNLNEADSLVIEKAQLNFIEKVYRSKGRSSRFREAEETVRFHGREARNLSWTKRY